MPEELHLDPLLLITSSPLDYSHFTNTPKTSQNLQRHQKTIQRPHRNVLETKAAVKTNFVAHVTCSLSTSFCRLPQAKEDQKCFVKATAWTCWAWLRKVFITGSLHAGSLLLRAPCALAMRPQKLKSETPHNRSANARRTSSGPSPSDSFFTSWLFSFYKHSKNISRPPKTSEDHPKTTQECTWDKGCSQD